MNATWHLLTGEYPPGAGGVGDYTYALARALVSRAAHVHVWSPAVTANDSADDIHLHGLPDEFGAASRQLLEAEWRKRPGVVLLQYVPNALGAKGLNVAFCRWLRRHGRHSDVRVMFHEPYFYFSWNPAGNVRAAVQRVMARQLTQAAGTVYLSTETWRGYLQLPARTLVLPVPSTIPRACGASSAAGFRDTRMAMPRSEVIGHFGTYGDHVASELAPVVPLLLEARPFAQFACIGRGSEAFAATLRDRDARFAGRIHATGTLTPSDVAAALCACDVVVQPYPDGVTTRRTSVMAAIANGVATVSTRGALTERVWEDTHAVALAPAGDARQIADAVVRLLKDETARAETAAAGRRAYDAHFAIEKTVDVLLAS